MPQAAYHIGMKNILIIGASGGIGAALYRHHKTRGDDVVGLSRSVDGLDIVNAQSVAHHLGQLGCSFDRVIVATGALSVNGTEPEKTIKAVDARVMADQFAVNAIGPALIWPTPITFCQRIADRYSQYCLPRLDQLVTIVWAAGSVTARPKRR